ncbi:unnamed protein product [Knipowitschia caucasica]
MTDVLLLVFKTFARRSGSVVTEGSSVDSAPSALMVGGHSLSRSVLLLAAVTAASESGLRVVFLTHTQIQSLPVALQRRVPTVTPDALKKIKFCYPRTLQELLVQVAGLHESLPHSPPALIIVDGLEHYLCAPAAASSSAFNTSEQSSAAHLSALLCDTASFLTQRSKKQGSPHTLCRLVASFQPQGHTEPKGGESSAYPVLDVLDRYFQVRCTLDQDSSYESTSGGLQQVWNIYLSCLGMKNTSHKDGAEKKEEHPFHEWRLLLLPDGLMEFEQAQKH